jgi:hypothetical protein
VNLQPSNITEIREALTEAHEIIRDQVKRCQVEEDELTCELCAHSDTCRAYQWLERMGA